MQKCSNDEVIGLYSDSADMEILQNIVFSKSVESRMVLKTSWRWHIKCLSSKLQHTQIQYSIRTDKIAIVSSLYICLFCLLCVLLCSEAGVSLNWVGSRFGFRLRYKRPSITHTHSYHFSAVQ